MNEIEARAALDEAIRAYSAVFDTGGTVSSWALVYERSALFPEHEDEPLRFALSYAGSVGASPATVLGLLSAGQRLALDGATASFYPPQDDNA